MKLIAQLYHTGSRDASDWRLLHHGSKGSRTRRRVPAAKAGSTYTLRDIPAIDGNAEATAALIDNSIQVIERAPGEMIE